MCRFSVIIPVYNTEKYIDECLQSVQQQTFQNFEIILVDDGSKDNSGVICNKYSENDKRIHVLHKNNGGLSSARNFGLDRAAGEYVLFLDSDDYWCDKEMLTTIDQYINCYEADVFIFGFKKFYQNDGIYKEIKIHDCNEAALSRTEAIRLLMEENLFVACAWDKVIRRSFIDDNQLCFVEKQLSEDIEWCARILSTEPRIKVIPNYFYVYRQQNSASITANVGRKNLEDILEVIKKYVQFKDDCLPLMHFISNQYVIWMVTSNYIRKGEIEDLLHAAQNYWGLLDYNWYPYVRKVSDLKLLGFGAVRYLLGLYRRFKLRKVVR